MVPLRIEEDQMKNITGFVLINYSQLENELIDFKGKNVFIC